MLETSYLTMYIVYYIGLILTINIFFKNLIHIYLSNFFTYKNYFDYFSILNFSGIFFLNIFRGLTSVVTFFFNFLRIILIIWLYIYIFEISYILKSFHFFVKVYQCVIYDLVIISDHDRCKFIVIIIDTYYIIKNSNNLSAKYIIEK